MACRLRRINSWVGLALVVVFLTAGGAVSVRSADADPAWYPKPLGEIKAMLLVLAPERDAADRMKERYIQRLKIYRYVCGVPYEDLTWDDEYATLTEKASLVCSKLDKLTHSPEKPAGMSDEEYKLGKRGAGESNLFMGRTSPSGCVDGWMDDSDPSNIDRVGHRRWCLNPKMLKSAFGTVGRYAAMYAFDGSRKSVPDWDYVTFPARGYMPIDLFGGRYAWSVSINMAKYAKPSKGDVKPVIQPVDEKLENIGGPLKLDYFNVETGGFGSGPAIIFRPESFAVKADARFKVNIEGVKTKDGKAATIEYLVHFADVRKAPDSPESQKLMTAYFRKQLDGLMALTDRAAKLESLQAFAEEELLKSADPALSKEARTTVAELLKDPVLRKEQDATQRYKMVAEMERKAGKNKKQLIDVATTYRDFANVFKGTRAGEKAAADFERLKKELQ
jgi:hypothetical protein